MAPPALLPAQGTADRQSTFFDSIPDEAKGKFVAWASSICSFHRSDAPHPYGLLFDVNWTFSSVMAKGHKILTIAEDKNYAPYLRATPRYKYEGNFLLSPSIAGKYDVLRFLGPGLKELAVQVSSDEVLKGVLQVCKDLKSLKLDIPYRLARLRTTGNLIQQLLLKHSNSIEQVEGKNWLEDGPEGILFSGTFPRLSSLSLSGYVWWVHEVVQLPGFGGSVEKLDLKLDGKCWKHSMGIFEAIRVQFPRVTSIHVEGEYLPLYLYEKLLISYGDQLRHVGNRTIYGEIDTDLHVSSRFEKHCPNFEFKLRFGESSP